MRKLFSILCASLVALAMQATVVTQDFNLSDFSGNASFVGSVITASDNSWQGIYKNDGYSAFALSESHYTDLVVELSAEPEVNLFVQVSYSDASSNDFMINTTQTSGRLTLASANVTSVAIKLVDAGSATLSKVYFYKVVGKAGEDEIFTGPKDLGDNWQWDNRVEVSGSAFAAAHEGDMIRYTYTSLADAQCAVRTQDAGSNLIQLANAGEYGDVTSEMSEPASCSFMLTATDIDNLQSKGLFITGKNMTIQNVTLVTYSQQIMVEKVLNTGNESLGTNWGQHWLHTTDLPTLAAGDELRVTVSAVTGEYPQVNFRHDDNGNNPVVIEGIDATVPKVYSVSLTAAQANDINSGKLFIVGQNNSLSHFAIAQPMSIYDENLLWYGEEAAGDEWSRPVSLPASKFSGVEVGDILHVLLTELDAAGQLSLTQGDYAEFSVKPSFNLNSTCAAPMALSFVINASMKDELQANGLFVSGKKFTVSAVYVIKATAHKESYTLKVSNADMATLVLPFNVPDLPAGVEAYRLTYDGSEAIEATPVSAIQADKPVLIIAAANEDPGYEFVSELGADTCIFYKSTWSVGTYQDGALHGNYVKAFNTPNKYESDYFYVLQNGASGVGFYQLQYWGDVKVNPYRAFLGCSLNLNGFDTSSAPGRKMRIVFHKDATTDIVTVENAEISTQKILRNGQIYILRNGVEYNVNGQMTK